MESQKSKMIAFLAEHDVPCHGCGYNMRGAPSTVCPECGERLPFDHPRALQQDLRSARRVGVIERGFLERLSFWVIILSLVDAVVMMIRGGASGLPFLSSRQIAVVLGCFAAFIFVSRFTIYQLPRRMKATGWQIQRLRFERLYDVGIMISAFLVAVHLLVVLVFIPLSTFFEWLRHS